MFLQSAKSRTMFYFEYIGYVPFLLPYQRPECCFKSKTFSCLDRNITIFRDFQEPRPRRDFRIARPRRDRDTQKRVSRPRHVSRHPALPTGYMQVTYFCQERVRYSLAHKICPLHFLKPNSVHGTRTRVQCF